MLKLSPLTGFAHGFLLTLFSFLQSPSGRARRGGVVINWAMSEAAETNGRGALRRSRSKGRRGVGRFGARAGRVCRGGALGEWRAEYEACAAARERASSNSPPGRVEVSGLRGRAVLKGLVTNDVAVGDGAWMQAAFRTRRAVSSRPRASCGSAARSSSTRRRDLRGALEDARTLHAAGDST